MRITPTRRNWGRYTAPLGNHQKCGFSTSTDIGRLAAASTPMTSEVDVAIVGAGPYGLSLAAHLQALGVEYRVFGRPMDTWRHHMPEGMLLKSDGFASSLSDLE